MFVLLLCFLSLYLADYSLSKSSSAYQVINAVDTLPLLTQTSQEDLLILPGILGGAPPHLQSLHTHTHFLFIH